MIFISEVIVISMSKAMIIFTSEVIVIFINGSDISSSTLIQW